jgi:D-alanyl-D-alanine carboxypeptidase/D-alanyl-D-alanine-endopeptidase (penicillin-binding protein 4)
VVDGTDPARLARRIEHHTPLVPVLEHMNKESQNFYAEQVFKTLGASWGGTGSWRTGQEAVLHFLEAVGLAQEGIVADDGSGLSRENRLTAWHLTELLRVMHESPYRRAFRESLAVIGADGTLDRRLTDDDYRGRIQAKTGSLAGVRALTGYATTRDGRELVFSLLANHTHGPVADAQDAFCRILIDATGP